MQRTRVPIHVIWAHNHKVEYDRVNEPYNISILECFTALYRTTQHECAEDTRQTWPYLDGGRIVVRRVLDAETAANVEISAMRVSERARQYHGVRNDLEGVNGERD